MILNICKRVKRIGNKKKKELSFMRKDTSESQLEKESPGSAGAASKLLPD